MGDPVREGLPADSWYERIWPRLDAGPLSAVMVELIDWLVAQGYSPATQRNQVRAAARLGSWILAEELGLDGVDAECVIRLVGEDNERYPEHRSANENVSAVLRFLRETGRLKPSRAAEKRLRPAQECLAQWLRVLEVEQGRGDSWIGKARGFGERFLGVIEDEHGDLRWERVTVAMVNEFLVGAIAGYSSSSAQAMAALLRGLLTWAAVNGWVGDGVVGGVLSPRRVRGGSAEGAHRQRGEGVEGRCRSGQRDGQA